MENFSRIRKSLPKPLQCEVGRGSSIGSRVLQIKLRYARFLWNSLHKTCSEIKDFG
ncbi:hypothetical protein HMPREF9225_0752 [Peptoniphilus duerdenii ATCC BAA-1640]|uniref:Uncharacterized protein n=1 Tax=Peptoniphilus duerdenii ATCC BAA-1640 TaxID=862517 RepID=E0NKR3_9FIRM|nr:hypothetical protein HMPREF9225_0752 [Peptoniphilus duerdenii ATCC BAA-1640]